MPATASAKPVRITVDLDPKLHRRLKMQAAQDGSKVSDLVRGWVEAHCEDYDDWFRKAVKKGLDDVKAGRVLTWQESKKRHEARIAALQKRIR